MAKGPDISRAMGAVALMALSKREFFQRLLNDPEQALAKVRGELNLTDDDVADVTRAIREGTRDITPSETLALWDDWRATGIWAGGAHWPMRVPYWPDR